ncbi:MAG: flavin reductase [Eubacteriaceae bacterium]
MKREIEVFKYSKEILEAMKKGILLTTKVGENVNAMTISWGMLGIEWEKEIFTVFVRENRFTKVQLDKNPEFTINVPYGKFNKKILGICGTKSGHVTDKIKEAELTLETPQIISVPGIKELPLTLECRVVYKQKQDSSNLSKEDNANFYPPNIDSTFHGANKDYHTAYYGEIVSAYIIEEN